MFWKNVSIFWKKSYCVKNIIIYLITVNIFLKNATIFIQNSTYLKNPHFLNDASYILKEYYNCLKNVILYIVHTYF